MKYLLFFVLIQLSFLTYGMQQFSFVRYQVENGLSHNTVWCVMQDKKGFMWFGTSEGLNRFDGKNFHIFRSNPQDSTTLGNNIVRSLCQDNDHNIWIGTNRGLYLFNSQTEEFRLFANKTEDDVRISSNVNCILKSNTGDVWIATHGQGIFIYHPQTNTLTQDSKHSSFVKCLVSTPGGDIYASSRENGLLCFDQSGKYLRSYTPVTPQQDSTNIEINAIYYQRDTLWFSAGNNMLNRLALRTGQIKAFPESKDNINISNIRNILAYNEHQLFIGADNGLYLFDTRTGNYERIDNPLNPKSLSDQSIYNIIKDREGGFWFSTYFGGVNYLPQNLKAFQHYFPSYQEGSLSGKAISQFCEDPQGNIWIATEDGGLNFLDTRANKIKHYLPDTKGNGISTHNIHALLLDGDKLWIGTFSEGLDILDLKSGRFKNYRHKRGDVRSLSDNGVYSIYKDSRGSIYVGTVWGLNKYNPSSDNFTIIPEVGSMTHIYDIKEDHKGYLWFATYNTGVFRYNPGTDEWKHYIYKPNLPESISSNSVICIFQDSRKVLWFGTEGGGICSFNYETETFVPLDPEHHILPNNVTYAIEEDENGYFWIASNAGLIRMNPRQQDKLKLFTKADGLQSNQFNFRSSLRARNGKFYFGGINGFNTFYPKDFIENKYIPQIAIIGFRLFNKEITPKEINSPLRVSMQDTRELTLNYQQNTFSFDFAALSYQAPEKNEYAYILEGADKTWIYCENKTTASYNNLHPGHYTFRVKASNNDGIWNLQDLSVKVEIRPPFWATGIAYTIYTLILLTIAFWAFRMWSQRMASHHKALLKEYRVRKEQETYESKINFFTNVAHEIRTPLSLIKTPLECIIQSEDGNTETRKFLSTIDKNTDRLLNLVNQLLDFRKTEEHEFKLQPANCDMNELIRNISARFAPSAQLKQIQLNLVLPEPPLISIIDPEALTKVISNLLSNAMKYTRNKIMLQLINEKDCFEIRVSDNGDGIAQSEQKKIFEVFYQADHSKSGTGIGLALSKLLTEKHGGKLYLTDSGEQGATFVVYIPKSKGGITETKKQEIIIPEITISQFAGEGEEKQEGNAQIPKLLITEDNTELLELMSGQLGKFYQVLKAHNGKEAIDILSAETIDIIISDVMMPEMDGYELCETVKSDPQYCHIPVILLTAKATTDDKIKGLKYGSDAYIEKPFSLEHLKNQIKNLLESRSRLKEIFAASPFAAATSVAVSPKDKEFIEKLNDEIGKHIQEVDFSIDILAEIMCMSRSNFYRKIRGVTGMSPNDYLKMIRLKTAAELLLRQEYRINEIFELVGFNTSSYFIKCFKKQFGVPPREFIAAHTAKTEEE